MRRWIREAAGTVALERDVHLREVRLQRFDEVARQHRHAILATLARTDIDGEAIEVDVFHAEPHALHQTSSGAVQQCGHEPGDAVEMIEQRDDLLAREHDRQSLALLRARRAGEAAERRVQHVQKHERVQSLILRGRRYVTTHCKVGQILDHVRFVQRPWMTQRVESHVVLHPVHVAVLGANGVVLAADDLA